MASDDVEETGAGGEGPEPGVGPARAGGLGIPAAPAGALRFIHTSDWQLGLRAGFLPGDTGAAVREARLETVRRIGRVAAETGAAFVVVAGDVFEHHEVAPSVVRKAIEALRDYPCPVYLLPGNHDPYIAHGLYRSAAWVWPDNVHILGAPHPVRVAPDPRGTAGPLPDAPVWLLPAPWLEHDSLTPFWAHLDAQLGRAPGTPRGFRVGVAHGGNADILASLRGEHSSGGPGSGGGLGDDLGEDGAWDGDAAQDLPSSLPDDADLDYLAAGDWHGLLRIGPRYYYSGTPEATRFDEHNPGNVLVVTLPPPRDAERSPEPPRVDVVPVATHRWVPREPGVTERELTEAADVDALDAWFQALPDRSKTLVELHLRGTLSLADRARLDHDVLRPAAEALRFLRVRDERLHSQATDADLDALEREGWVGRMVERLRRDAPEDPAAAGALQLVYRLHKEVSS